MDAQRFDALVRTLSTPRSRRQLAKVLAGGALGTLAMLRRGLVVEAKPGNCSNVGSKCTKGTQCCTGICTNRVCVDPPCTCSDGNQCTTDFCDASGVCQHTPLTNTPCDTRNGPGTCLAGQCVAHACPGGVGSDICLELVDNRCGPGGTCVCGETVNGDPLCIDAASSNCRACANDDDCAIVDRPGTICVKIPCCSAVSTGCAFPC